MKLKEFRSEQLVRYILHVGVVRSAAWACQHVQANPGRGTRYPTLLVSPHTPPRFVTSLLLLPTARHAFLS